MASPDTISPPPPSAAARVFAIPELFEKIMLDLIASEVERPAVRPSTVACYRNSVQPEYIEDQFRLLRINRHTYATIITSKPIQTLCFAPTSLRTSHITSRFPDRLVWLSLACKKFMLAKTLLGTPAIIFPARPKGKTEVERDDSPSVSWRKYRVMSTRGFAETFEVMQCLFTNDAPSRWRKVVPLRDARDVSFYFRFDRKWTLGELYDKILEVQPGEVDNRPTGRLGNNFF